MTIDEWLAKTIKILEVASVPTARLDTEVLLADALEKDRSWIHAHPDHNIEDALKVRGRTLHELDGQVTRRAEHEPLAYVRGKQEFYGRDFIVSPDTLTPRPETETMIELLKKLVEGRRSKVEQLQIVDVGTGSGCIIITAALELAQISNIEYRIFYTGLDISEPALKIAKQNSIILNQKVKFVKFDLLTQPLTPYLVPHTVLLANLPYVPENYKINKAAAREPKLAIFGGMDGLDYYRVLFKKLNSDVNYILTESLPFQHEKLKDIAEENGYSLVGLKGLTQTFEPTKL